VSHYKLSVGSLRLSEEMLLLIYRTILCNAYSGDIQKKVSIEVKDVCSIWEFGRSDMSVLVHVTSLYLKSQSK
jgi:hypothetical protein